MDEYSYPENSIFFLLIPASGDNINKCFLGDRGALRDIYGEANIDWFQVNSSLLDKMATILQITFSKK